VNAPTKPLTVAQERFAIAYLSGPEGIRGNGTRAYREAYPEVANDKNAGSAASRLLARVNVRARIRELRDEAEKEARGRLVSWMEEAPTAQRVLLDAMEGRLKGTDEEIRQAVKAAQSWLDRALGSVQQMHNVDVVGTGVQIIVAAGVITHEKQSEKEPGRIVALP
jgi:hypothetical protein